MTHDITSRFSDRAVPATPAARAAPAARAPAAPVAPATPAAWLALVAALAGCVDAGAPIDPPVDPPVEPDLGPPVSSPDELTGVPDGSTGWARVRTPTGVELLPYVARNGVAVYDGDTNLGRVSSVDARLRGGALTSSGTRWTNTVEYAFHPGFTGDPRTRVRQAISELEVLLPIDFREVTYGQHTGPWIEFKWGPDDAKYGGMSSAIGMMGCGELHCSSEGECRTDCGQWIYFKRDGDQPTVPTTKHEILHALGMYHEQSRNDRDEWVDYNPQCVASSAHNFAKRSESLDLGPYDFRSIMHYRSGAFCVKSLVPIEDPYLGSCLCLPLTKYTDDNNDGKPDKLSPSDDLTGEDVNTLWRAYHRGLGVNTAGDKFGEAIATADFDNDGYEDVAIGAPGNNSNTGAVLVFKGSSNGFLPWRTLFRSPAPAASAQGRFGAALAAGDIDGDGFADLVVGAPSMPSATMTQVGEVNVFKGSRGGLSFTRRITRAEGGGNPASFDQFGAAIAIGNLTSSPIREIVVGAPSGGAVPNTGMVYVFRQASAAAALEAIRILPAGLGASGLSGDRYGAALAVGPIDTDAHDDLVIGAPGGNDVWVFAGRNPTAADPLPVVVRKLIHGPSGGATDRFGAAVLIASVSSHFWSEIVVGAPGASSAAGRVYIYERVTQALTGPASIALAQTLESNGSHEPGDEFGYALAALGRDGAPGQLVVGSPGENNDAGIITVYRGDSAGVTAVANIGQSQIPLQIGEPGDRFGAALATGRIDGIGNQGSSDTFSAGTDDLVVGAPGDTGALPGLPAGPAAGTITLMVRVAGDQLIGTPAWTQATTARK